MMILKNIFKLIPAALLWGATLPCAWAQKQPVVKHAAQAVSGRPVAQSPAQLVRQTHLFMQQHHGKLPRLSISLGNGTASIINLSPLQQAEVRLARQAYYQIKSNPQPQNQDWRELQQLYTAREPKQALPSPEEFLPVLQAWVEAHNGLRPRLNFYENSRHLTADQLRQKDQEQGTQLYQEHSLARILDYLMRKGISDKMTREKLAAIETLPTLTGREDRSHNQFYDYFGQVLPAQYDLLKQLQTWSAAHDNSKPRVLFYHNKKRLSAKQLASWPHLYEEYQLGYRLRYVLSKGGQPSDLKSGLNAINNLPLYHPAKAPRDSFK